MTDPEFPYVVKDRWGRYMCPKGWKPCQVCAARYRRAEAHLIAHAMIADIQARVVRVTKRKRKAKP